MGNANYHHPLKLVSTGSHPELAEEVARYLGVELVPTDDRVFACGELYNKPMETVRGCDVYVITTATENVNHDMMELFILLDALKRSFAYTIHVVMPHFAYSRQDRVASPREPISAKLMADLIETAGADHVVTLRLHSDQIQGFFNFPVDNLAAERLFINYFKAKELENMVVVSPDAGGAKAAKKFADSLGAELAIVHKHRPGHNVSEVMNIVGEVEGKTCILYDDMIDTAGSVTAAKKALDSAGANSDVYLVATHPVFSGSAVERLTEAKLKEVVVTNSIPIPEEKKFPGLKVISVGELLADVITNVHDARSLTEVMRGENKRK
ncbi:ribose-phosphate pyrophosphokinase [Candidatus Peregrinibacteria bacterium]|jgi:ribose-phosphate pyrophosphokinase|nr:ribose-phosphate pyrophosphokinase [Candidatus Peregrinibacteria bacterium]